MNTNNPECIKVSELIKQLKAFHKTHGDKNVAIHVLQFNKKMDCAAGGMLPLIKIYSINEPIEVVVESFMGDEQVCGIACHMLPKQLPHTKG